MAVLDHTIAAAHDSDATALFFSEMLGLDPPIRLGHFSVVEVSTDGGTIDFVSTDGDRHRSRSPPSPARTHHRPRRLTVALGSSGRASSRRGGRRVDRCSDDRRSC